jgi:uncharacterized membrane protein
MAFCANCGTEVSGQFCPKCGTSMSGATPLGAPAGSTVSSTPMATNLASALCYIPFVGWIAAIVFLLIEPYNRDRTVRFHAWQSIGLGVVLIVVRIALAIVLSAVTSFSFGLGAMIGLLMMLFSLAVLILYIFLAFKTYQNQRIVIPVIGPFAEKQA